MQTGTENLRMMGRLSGLSRTQAKARASELLEQFELTKAAGRRVATYSGGMRRRLDIAASLVARPSVIFLDEPSTGLDPQSRLAMWRVIEGLAASGVTIFLTTQYLEEADRLADRIAVLDAGQIIAEGTAAELKRKVAAQRLDLTAASRAAFERLVYHFGACSCHQDDVQPDPGRAHRRRCRRGPGAARHGRPGPEPDRRLPRPQRQPGRRFPHPHWTR